MFWIALGATAGVLVMRRLSRIADAWSPEGIAERAGGFGERVTRAVEGFLADVSAAAAERESELREALGVTEPA